MPRKARRSVLYNGCFAHVYSRALEKRFIFREAPDFIFFKEQLALSLRSKSFLIHHYCLMNTHFHLLVSIEKLEDFSKQLKQLKETYVRYYHERYKKKGPVWWGRFGSQLIESEKYLYACGLYIEMNPVEAGMVRTPEDWPFSSSAHYFCGEPESLISKYDQPSRATAEELLDGLNVGRGSYIGTPLFLLNAGDI